VERESLNRQGAKNAKPRQSLYSWRPWRLGGFIQRRNGSNKKRTVISAMRFGFVRRESR
jgi:hypothetical protein